MTTAAETPTQVFTLNINGVDHDFAEDLDLLVVLRERLGIKSAKDGCNQGACGTCMVLVDGKVVRACTQRTKRLVGKKIITIEGFEQREKELFEYSFAKHGATQCGFCIPGMVVSAKGLVDAKPEPTRDEVKFAIRTNICRCTGYQQIEDAILDYAEMKRTDAPIPAPTTAGGIGTNLHRVDSYAKTLGTAEYVDDIEVEGLIHGRNVFSPCARALIKGIDTSEAEKMPGVVRILTASDIPGSRYIGHLAKDWPGMIAVGEETKMKGDTLALVIAETLDQAIAAAAVKIDYESWSPSLHAETGMAEGAPSSTARATSSSASGSSRPTSYDHEVVKRGDVEAGFARSTLRGGRLGPAGPGARLHGDRGRHRFPTATASWSSAAGQGIYDEYHEVATTWACRRKGPHPVRVGRWRLRRQGGHVGPAPAPLCAFLVQRPVKVVRPHRRHQLPPQASRDDRSRSRVGCDADGVLHHAGAGAGGRRVRLAVRPRAAAHLHHLGWSLQLPRHRHRRRRHLHQQPADWRVP